MSPLIDFEPRPDNVSSGSSMDHQVKEVLHGHWRTPNASFEDTRSVRVIRGLVLDCCQQWGIGHGGMVCFRVIIYTTQ